MQVSKVYENLDPSDSHQSAPYWSMIHFNIDMVPFAEICIEIPYRTKNI
jgi:hypothetical protein